MNVNVKCLIFLFLLLPGAALFFACDNIIEPSGDDDGYAGSVSCKECHERFYKLWSPSHHGKAMQPVTSAFVDSEVPSWDEWQSVEKVKFRVVKRDTSLIFKEDDNGTITEYKAIHALGGKNIYYFLTPFEKGRLQVLPLAYDINRKEWYNAPESHVRHFVDNVEDEALPWKHFLYTFNTTCHSCHVSQLTNNYDLETGNYVTTWKEPGINCESCHGPSQAHVDLFRKIKGDNVPEDIGLISAKKFSKDQHNSNCASCHAKMTPITSSYQPGERFYDHFNLITLDNIDYYPDGRDLGENYTFTSWSQGPCVQGGADFHCVTCHTSSGRYRFKDKDHNNACLPCHKEEVDDVSAHSHHPSTGESATCVSCHMQKTEFARMIRSDHSMRSPMPSATIEFGSPNACNICHDSKSAEWSDKYVREWYADDYQAAVLHVGKLIKEARSGDFSRIVEMDSYVRSNPDREIYAASLLRLIANAEYEKKWELFRHVLGTYSSPIVRAVAAEGLALNPEGENRYMLFNALNDSLRVVRMAASVALAMMPPNMLTQGEREILTPHLEEYKKSLMVRSDDWSAHYNLGNFYSVQQKLDKALKSYNVSIAINKEAVPPIVNAGYTHSLLGNYDEAEKKFRDALLLEPGNEAANLNLALLLGELKRMDEAEDVYREILHNNRSSAVAAFNLSIIVSSRDISECLTFGKSAVENAPQNNRYRYTYAYFLNQAEKQGEAISELTKVINEAPGYVDAYSLLASIYQNTGKIKMVIELYKRASKEPQLPDGARQYFARQEQLLRGE